MDRYWASVIIRGALGDVNGISSSSAGTFQVERRWREGMEG